MVTIKIIPEGPDVSNKKMKHIQEIEHDYLFDSIMIGCDEESNQFYWTDTWENYGPFNSHIEALTNIILKIIIESEKMYKDFKEINDITNKY